MRPRIATLCVLGAALTLAATAAAQDTTRTRPTSQQRIRVGKESPGEVVAPRIDTVTVFKTDTLRTFRTDTVTVTNTTTRFDTVTVQLAPIMPRQFGGFYVALAAGPSFPAANLNDASKPGVHAEGAIGIDPHGSGIGLRLGAGYSKFDPHSFYATATPDPQLMNADADIKLRMPGLNVWRLRLETYAVGGGTYNRYKDMAEINRSNVFVGESSAGTPEQLPADPDHSWHNKFGYNAGGGFAMGWGNANLFLESRYSRFNNRATVAHLPLVLGLMWY
jgi:hypothetical protein